MRILLLDEGFASGTHTALGLHAAGCTVDVIAATGGQTRCVGTGGEWRLGSRMSDAFVALVERTRRNGYDAIYPTTEPLQQLLWPYRRNWPELVLPTDGDTRPACFADKRAMSALARDAGVLIPDQI